MVIARVSKRHPNGHNRALETATEAEHAGWRDIHVDADAVRGTYVVTGEPPGRQHARNIIDGILGR